MSKQQQLDDLAQQIVDDSVCPDLAATATQLVFGDGNPDAEIVFIGEAPGKNEDIQGLPFVGAAGKFLNEMLALIGLERKDIYITNIVKYRPPNNRDPLPEEKSAFLSYLQKQMDIIKPKVIVTLGRHSMECFLPGLKISQAHGQPKRVSPRLQDRRLKTEDTGEAVASSVPGPQSPVSGVVILPLFHPAAALYNGGLRQTLIDDFMTIPAVIKTLNESK